jgi:Flp pilus assembly pilin Flp
MKLLRAFLTDTTAMNSIQYAFIAAGIAGTIIVGENATSVSFLNVWTTIATALR